MVLREALPPALGDKKTYIKVHHCIKLKNLNRLLNKLKKLLKSEKNTVETF